jgi:hypothetical protein
MNAKVGKMIDIDPLKLVIPLPPEESVFDYVGTATNFIPSLVPYACTPSLSPGKKIYAAFLSNSRRLRLFRYTLFLSVISLQSVFSVTILQPNIAMFFSGRIKGYEDSYQWLKGFIDQYNMDVFCSINSELDDYHREFIKRFNIKKYHFEIFNVPEKFFAPTIRSYPSIYNVCSMYYNHKKNLDLIKEYQAENAKRYDIIVYMRADIIPSNIGNTFDLIIDDNLHIPDIYDWADGLNDQMAYGSLQIMERYCSLFDSIYEYCTKYDILLNGEMLLKFHTEFLKIPIKRFHFLYCLNAKRKNE